MINLNIFKQISFIYYGMKSDVCENLEIIEEYINPAFYF